LHHALKISPLREEVLRKATEYTDQVRGVLKKEILARSAKVVPIDEAVREVRMRVRRAVADAIIEERTQREEGLIRACGRGGDSTDFASSAQGS
jgi:hypothetical protein